MYIETSIGKYYLEFLYSDDATQETTNTEARLYVGETHQKKREEQRYSYGMAFQNPSDRFDKEKGRQLALERAMAGFDKQTRREIWKAYFARSPKNAHIVEAITKACAAA